MAETFIPNGETISITGYVLDAAISVAEKIYYRIRKPNPLSLYKVMLELIESQNKFEQILREKGFTFG